MSSRARALTPLTSSATSPTWAPAVFISSRAPSKRKAPTFPTLSAITAPACSQPRVSSIFLRPCMLTKPPAGTKHERRALSRTHTLPGISSLCRGHFRRLRISRPPPPQRPREVHSLVALSFSAGGHRRRLGDVPLLPLEISRHILFTAN